MQKKSHNFLFWRKIQEVLPDWQHIRQGVLCLAFVLFSFISFSAFAANNHLSISVKNATLKEVLAQIKTKTGYDIFYNNTQIDLSRKVTISANDENVLAVLNKVFSGTNIKCSIVEDHIVLSEAPKATTSSSSQQNYTVRGKIVDEHGDPIIGAAVVEKGSNNAEITNTDGKFTLKLKKSPATLEVSIIGYMTQTLRVKAGDFINVKMKEDIKLLDQVVVIGYGSQKKASLTGSVASVDSKSLTDRPIADVAQGLQGWFQT